VVGRQRRAARSSCAACPTCIGDVKALEDLERIRLLFDDLESKKDIVQLLGAPSKGGRAHLHRLGKQAVFAVGFVAW
jgi:hypothetical protein